MPSEKYRLKDEEIISNEEYLAKEKGGSERSESLEQISTDFEFDNSRGIKNMPTANSED